MVSESEKNYSPQIFAVPSSIWAARNAGAQFKGAGQVAVAQAGAFLLVADLLGEIALAGKWQGGESQ
jgi:hypothetical protein